MFRIGVDTGGTFTDAVAQSDDGTWEVVKLPTTAERPSEAILNAVEALHPEGSTPSASPAENDHCTYSAPVDMAHGTTHATNALLTGKLGKVVFVTTQGFGDVLAIGRQDRDDVYALEPHASRPQQPATRIVEVKERVDARGGIVQNLSAAEIQRVVQAVKVKKPEAIAVAFLHAYASPQHEQKLGQALRKLGVPVMLSHEVAPEIREYERATTTWADASLAPVVRVALLDLRNGLKAMHKASTLRIMRSDGGTAAVEAAVEHPAALALSGPAGGLSAAVSLAQARGDAQIMTLDMGGTSTDVAWLDSALPENRPISVGRIPLLARGLPIHSVGTGGGSLASMDPGGLLQVGPESAGAVPGPACYGRGGKQATVTDAHLVCGRLLPDAFLGGDFELQSSAAKASVKTLGNIFDQSVALTAQNILQIASADMERALRRVSLAEGRDPRRATLYAFGGAGGLHAAWLADRLGMRGVVVPPLAGAFSALGLLGAPPRRRLTRSVLQALPKEAARKKLFAPYVKQLKQDLLKEGCAPKSLSVKRIVELRGEGQAGVLSLEEGPDLQERFHALHQQRFGFTRKDRSIELHAISVQVDGMATAPWKKERVRRQEAKPWGSGTCWFGTTGRKHKASYFARESMRPGSMVQGPAIITEYSATTVVPPRWKATLDAWNCLTLEPQS